MWKDPIVEEVRRAREQLLEECGFDLRKVMERLKAAEQLYGNRSVTPEELRERRARDGDGEAESRLTKEVRDDSQLEAAVYRSPKE